MGRHDLHRSTCAPYSFAVRERPIGACPDASRGNSARLGLDALPQELPDPLYDENAPYADGALRYELTDHLGNVCAVVSDALEGYSTDADPDAEEYHAELLSAQEYEPGGSLLPGRNFSTSSYRYLFQGQEHDDEINGSTGTSYAFEYRIHDPRIGRFMSVDPIAVTLPWYSPYQFAGNTPIWALDLEGLEPVVKSFTFGNSPTPLWFHSTQENPQEFTIEGLDNDETFTFKREDGKSSVQLVAGLECCQRPALDGTSSRDVIRLINRTVELHGSSVSAFDLLLAVLDQNPDVRLAVIGNHDIHRKNMLRNGVVWATPEEHSETAKSDEFSKLRADFVRAEFFSDRTNVDAYSRLGVDRTWTNFPRSSVPLDNLGLDARGITLLFDFRGTKNTPRRDPGRARPVDSDTRYKSVRHL